MNLNLAKKKQLEKNGWAVGDAGDFLQLREEEHQFVELKLALAQGVREMRERLGLTQTEVAERIGSSQSRVAKMEAADASVSLDLTIRSVLHLGATTAEIARWIRKAEGRLVPLIARSFPSGLASRLFVAEGFDGV